MGSYVIVEYLIPLQDGGILLLQAAHSLFPVPDLAVDVFHFVVVHVALEFDCLDVVASWIFVPSNCPSNCIAIASSSIER